MAFILELWSQGIEEMQFLCSHPSLALLFSVLNREKNCYLVSAGCIVRFMNNRKNFKEKPLKVTDVGDRQKLSLF